MIFAVVSAAKLRLQQTSISVMLMIPSFRRVMESLPDLETVFRFVKSEKLESLYPQITKTQNGAGSGAWVRSKGKSKSRGGYTVGTMWRSLWLPFWVSAFQCTGR